MPTLAIDPDLLMGAVMLLMVVGSWIANRFRETVASTDDASEGPRPRRGASSDDEAGILSDGASIAEAPSRRAGPQERSPRSTASPSRRPAGPYRSRPVAERTGPVPDSPERPRGPLRKEPRPGEVGGEPEPGRSTQWAREFHGSVGKALVWKELLDPPKALRREEW